MGFTSSHHLASDDHSGVYIVCMPHIHIHIHIHVHMSYIPTLPGWSSVCYSPPSDQPASQQPAFLFQHDDDLQTSVANMNSSYSYTVILSSCHPIIPCPVPAGDCAVRNTTHGPVFVGFRHRDSRSSLQRLTASACRWIEIGLYGLCELTRKEPDARRQ